MAVQNHTYSRDHHPSHTGTGKTEKKLLLATFINVAITIVEVTGGIISGSLALISDALHNLGDGIAVFIAFLAQRVSRRDSNVRKTFGYKRIEILAAFINSVIMAVVCFFLVVEAIKRFTDPSVIKGFIMFIVAASGLVANILAVLILRNDSGKNLNVKVAYLHLLGDTLSSIVVITGSLLIHFFGLYFLDPLMTILISLYILKQTFLLLKESVNILMQSTPESLNLNQIKEEIDAIPEVSNIHHIHAWNLNDQEIHFEGHLDLKNDMKMSETEVIRKKVENLLRDRYHITHITLQLEHCCCDDAGMIHNR